ncbi:hypothetical protein [Aeromonas phage AS-yj]|uniref:Uncharacterized protein n=2 Tax=Ceceduovirus aszj TaxID=2843652 RepID=A0A223LEC6_9CAUD|nr:hypothetical protein HWB28_gp167 [Aeromonas phage AS-zj]ASU00385.1 hypothetical protein [Aeromonas phage AS-zj]ATI17896.1 hypothetical protein [Aeromonas phage AS-yj]QMV28815.1 hypothetical protein AP1_0108 [Aeromonas phage AP1]
MDTKTTYEQWVEQNQEYLIRYIKENISLWVGVEQRDNCSSISTKVSVELFDRSEHEPLTSDSADDYFNKD